MNERGAIGLRKDDELRGTVVNYPVNLWRWLYKSALVIANEDAKEPFPSHDKESSFMRVIRAFLSKLF
jgi:hypothetical protein